MANFPTTIVTTAQITNANPATSLSANNHSSKHDTMRDEIIALENKVGADSSLVTTSFDYKLGEVTGTDKVVGKSAIQTVLNKILGTGTKIILGSDAVGDTWYATASNIVARLGIGSTGQVLTVAGGIPVWQSPSGTNFNYVADTGAANAYVATLVPALASYTAGVLVQFKATNANTTASTVNVNGLGVKTIKKLGGATDLASGDIAAGMIVELEYDGTNFVMLNPVANAPLLPNGSAASLTNIPLNIYTTSSSTNQKLAADNVSATISGATNTKVKEIIVNYGGVISTYFEAQGNGLGTTAAQVFVNDIALGTSRTPLTNGSYTAYTEDITVNAGSRVQVKATGTGGGTAQVKNFRIRYDKTISDEGLVVLN